MGRSGSGKGTQVKILADKTGYKIFETHYGSIIVPDNSYTESSDMYDNGITCPECGCKSGIKKA